MSIVGQYLKYRPVLWAITVLLYVAVGLDFYDTYLTYAVPNISKLVHKYLLLLVLPSVLYGIAFMLILDIIVIEGRRSIGEGGTLRERLSNLTDRMMFVIYYGADITTLASSLDDITLFPLAVFISFASLLFYIFLASLSPLLYLGITLLLEYYGYALPSIVLPVLYGIDSCVILFAVVSFTYLAHRRAITVIREVEEKYGYVTAIRKG